MFAEKLNDHIYLIDLKPLGFENFIASYLVKAEKTLIIETGPSVSVENLLTGLNETGTKTDEIDYVAVSHIHIDHAGGAGTLLRHLPNAKLIVHPKGAPHLASPERLWEQSKQVLGEVAETYGEIQPVPKQRIVAAVDGMVVDLGRGIELRVLETLGHASHHLSFHESVAKGVFPGDAAGIYVKDLDVVIPTTPFPFRLDETLASLHLLIDAAPERLYYTHFGPVSDAVKKLQAYVEQLTLWGEVVYDGVKKGEDMETIRERILQRDPSARKAFNFIKDHPLLGRGIFMQSIRGFVECFRANV